MELATAIDGLFDQTVDELDDGSFHAQVLELERESQRLEALKARRLAEWNARMIWASDGSKAPGARLARDAHRSPTATRAEVRRAKHLRAMPRARPAFEAGRIAAEHVDRLCDANRPVLRDRFTEAEPMLVSWAIEFAYDDFTTSIDAWIQIADDDRAEDQARKARDGRTATCARTLGGRRDLQATLDPIGGAIVENELFRLERLLFEQDWADAKEIHGDNTQLDHLARTSAQRRADALVLMAERSAAMPPDAKAGRILVSILLDYETAVGRLCELMDGTVLTPGELVPYLDRGWMERIVFDGRSRVIDVGTQTPFFTGALRRAIEIRDRHCQFPGCRTPAERCDVDHIIERCNGGPTTQDNARLLCGVHNRQRPGRRTTDTGGNGPPATAAAGIDRPGPDPGAEPPDGRPPP